MVTSRPGWRRRHAWRGDAPLNGGANGKREVRFADTMVMSTYLVAFVVGPLVATDPVDVDDMGRALATIQARAAPSAGGPSAPKSTMV